LDIVPKLDIWLGSAVYNFFAKHLSTQEMENPGAAVVPNAGVNANVVKKFVVPDASRILLVLVLSSNVKMKINIAFWPFNYGLWWGRAFTPWWDSVERGADSWPPGCYNICMYRLQLYRITLVPSLLENFVMSAGFHPHSYGPHVSLFVIRQHATYVDKPLSLYRLSLTTLFVNDLCCRYPPPYTSFRYNYSELLNMPLSVFHDLYEPTRVVLRFVQAENLLHEFVWTRTCRSCSRNNFSALSNCTFL